MQIQLDIDWILKKKTFPVHYAEVLNVIGHYVSYYRKLKKNDNNPVGKYASTFQSKGKT